MRSLPPPSGLRGGGGNRASDVTARLRTHRINTPATAAPGADTSRDPGRCALPASLSPGPRHAVSAPGPTQPDATRPDARPCDTRDPPTPRRVSDTPGPTAAQGTVCPRPPQLAASPLPASPERPQADGRSRGRGASAACPWALARAPAAGGVANHSVLVTLGGRLPSHQGRAPGARRPHRPFSCRCPEAAPSCSPPCSSPGPFQPPRGSGHR